MTTMNDVDIRVLDVHGSNEMKFGEIWVAISNGPVTIPKNVYDYKVPITNLVYSANYVPELFKMLDLRNVDNGQAYVRLTVTSSFSLKGGIYGPYNKQCTGCAQHGTDPRRLVRILEAILGIAFLAFLLRSVKRKS